MGSRRVLVGAALAMALLLAGCGGDKVEVPPDATTPTTPTTATTTTVLPETTQATVTSSSPNPSACPAIAARTVQPTDQTIPADFDGDGSADILRVYQVGGAWHVRGEIDGEGFHDQVVTPRGPSGLEPIFGARLNPSDDTEEAWVKVGSGASTAILTIFVFRDCELQRPTLNGEPVELPVGASVKNAVGVSCFMFDQAVEVFETHSDDGISYTGESQLYTLNVTSQPAPTLDPVDGWPMPVEAGNPQGHLSRLTCGSQTYP